MRRKLVLGVGLAALVGGTAAGQYSPPAMPTPKLGGFQPLSPPRPPAPSAYTPTYSAPAAGYVPPVDGVRPASYSSLPAAAAPAPSFTPLPAAEIPSALGKNHPWQIQPEHGPYFIMVKSYVRPAKGSSDATADNGLSARELAEGLAADIRDTYKVQAFLYEYISEERKAEERAKAVARQNAAAYIAQLDVIKQKAQLQGMEFIAPDNRLHMMTHYHRDQIGVLVGGFQSEADALKALVVLKKWPTPKNEVLLDKGAIVQPGPDGKPVSVRAAINPYAGAFVVPNPVATRAAPAAQRQGLDPFVVKLNDDNPYSLLKATKPWTLAIKSFTAPVTIANKDSDTSLMRRIGFGKSGSALVAGGEQAEAMAKALRGMKGPGGQALNLEVFVLHTRSASLVTIGQFDGPDDPALHATKRMLNSIKMNVSEDQSGLRPAANAPSVFDRLLAMPVPKP